MEFIGRYRIVDPLGFGGSGTVYKCIDPDNGNEVAIKLFAPPQSTSITAITQMLDRFKKESRLMSSLSHQNIVKMLEYGQVEGQPFIVLEFVKVTDKKKFSPEETLDVLIQTTKALQFSHSKNIIHRDIKPENILISEDGGKFTVKLSDFGIAYVGDQTVRMTNPGEFVGTFAYMSPEQIASEVPDAKTDIYSLGLVAYEFITGKKAFDGLNPAQIISQIMMANPKPPSKVADNVPVAFERIILKMIRKDKQARFHSMTELLDALEELVKAGLGGVSDTKDIIRTTLFSPLVGRDEEVLILSRSLNDSMSNVMQMKFLLGPTGIGKTRLAVEMSSMARSWGMQIININLSKELASSPFGLLRLIAEQIWDRNVPSEFAIGMALLSPAIAYDLKINLPEIRPSEVHGLISSSFSWLLDNSSDNKPLYLLIDDFQNCDSESAEILGKYMEKPHHSRSFLVFTVNTDLLEQNSKPSKLVELAKNTGLALTLNHLNEDNIQRLIESSLGVATIPKELSNFISTESVGNPLMASEILKAFIGSGIIEIRDENVKINESLMELPDNLAQLQTMMTSNISLSTREALRVASVIGESFSADIVSSVADKPIFHILTAFEEGLAHQVIRIQVTKKGNTYRFSHERFRKSLEDTADSQTRLMINEKAASYFEQNYSENLDIVIDDYVRHLLGGSNPPKAIPHLLRSAKLGMDKFQDEEAISKAKKAIELSKENLDDVSIIRALIIISEIHKIHGRLKEGLDVCEEAHLYAQRLAIPNNNLMITLLRVKGTLLSSLGKMDESTEMLTSAKNLCDDECDTIELVTILTNLATNLRRTDIANATSYSMKALEVSRKMGDPIRIAAALTAYGQMLRTQGHFKEAVEQLEQAVVIGETKGVHTFIAQTYSNLAPMYFMDMGDYEKGKMVANKARGIAKLMNNLCQLGYLDLVEGYAAYQYGDFENASKLLSCAIDTFEKTGELPKLMSTYAFLGEVFFEQEDVAKSSECLKKAVTIQYKLGMTFPVWEVVSLEISILMHEKKVDQAEVVIQKYLDSVPKSARNSGIESSVNHARAMIELDRGNTKQAINILKELAKEVEQSDNLSYKANTFQSLGNIYIRILDDASKMNAPKRLVYFTTMGLFGKDVGKLAAELLDKSFLFAIEQSSVKRIVSNYVAKTKLEVLMAKISDPTESATHIKNANENLWKAIALNADLQSNKEQKETTKLILELSELQK
jgi:serine/threonine protein kinase/tetratricopeptide (TPR) repeat protein